MLPVFVSMASGIDWFFVVDAADHDVGFPGLNVGFQDVGFPPMWALIAATLPQRADHVTQHQCSLHIIVYQHSC